MQVCGRLQVLKALAVESTSAGAAQLLRSIGAWGPHDQAPVLRVHLSNNFSPRLEVRRKT